jgi:hypothetical protein
MLIVIKRYMLSEVQSLVAIRDVFFLRHYMV